MANTALPDGDWTPPTANGDLAATVRVPGSKSLTNRAYVLAALAGEATLVRAPLDSRDTRLMLDALSAMGAVHHSGPDGVLVSPITTETSEPANVALGNAGTVARFTPALAGLSTRPVHFDGDEAIRRRPLGPLLRALVSLGVEIDDQGRGAPPFTVYGQGAIAGGEVELDSSASSQFLSALLLAGPSFDHGVTVKLVGNAPPSEPHIAMTLDLLRRFGANPQRNGDVFHVPPAALSCPDFQVEPDLSTAAPFAVAAAAVGGTVHIADWPMYTTQPGDWLRSLLTELGQQVTVDDRGLTVTGTGQLPGIRLDLHEVGELTPVIAALLCFADGPSVISGVAHLRGHETDRLAALATELSALGANVTETEDGLRIVPAPLHGGRFHTYHDHRLVMAAAVLALRTPGITVENPTTVAKTFPNFPSAWTTMVTPQ